MRLVNAYGAPGPNSSALGAADPAQAPGDDILGYARSDPDLGAFERDPANLNQRLYLPSLKR